MHRPANISMSGVFLCPSFVFILNNRLLYGKIGRIEYETEGVKAAFIAGFGEKGNRCESCTNSSPYLWSSCHMSLVTREDGKSVER